MDDGTRARHVVMPLIRNALHIADGHLHGILDVQERLTAAHHLIDKARTTHPELNLTPPPPSISPPHRPRPGPPRPPDLLDNLLHAITTCWHLYQHHTENPHSQEARQTFVTALREEAASRPERLL
ncbi:hypothetical protein GCM10020001_078350 [Nonomuraea salmonea]